MTSVLNLTPETRVNTTTANFQFQPVVATLADGSYVVVWDSYSQDTDGYGVFMQHYSASGVRIGGEVQVNTTVAQGQLDPAIAALDDGGFVIAWDGNGAGDTAGVYFQRYDASATAVGVEQRANSFTTGTQTSPSVSGLVGGGFVISWDSVGQDGSADGVYARMYDGSTNPVGTETQVNQVTASYQYAPRTVTLADGSYVITWISNNQDGDGTGIYFRHYAADGTALTTEFQANTTTTGGQQFPAIAALSDGGFVIAWSGNGPGDSNGIFFQRFNSTGAALGSETLAVPAGSASSYVQDSVDVTALADGGFVVVYDSSFEDGNQGGIFATRFDALGNMLGGATQLNTYTNNNQLFGRVSAFSDGGYVAVWASSGEDGSNDGVYSRSYHGATSLVGTQYLYGTADGDTLDGGSGNDYMYGGAGNDVYYVNSQSDHVVENASSGRDTVVSSLDYFNIPQYVEDLILATGAGSGYGNNGDNTMTGNSGDNILAGNGGNDHLIGGDGNDTLYGGDNNDELAGGSGDDTFYGGVGSNVMDGQDGDDVFVLESPNVAGIGAGTSTDVSPNASDFDSINGGHGVDTLDATRLYTDLTVNLASGKVVENGLRIAQLTEVEDVWGGSGNDHITGNSDFNRLYGYDGNDVLDGGANDDDLFGGAGSDTASYVSSTAGVTVDLRLQDQDQDTGGSGFDYLDSIENLTGSKYSDTLTGDNNANVLDGGGSSDRMSGGLGNDTYYFTAGDIIVESANQGTDLVYSAVTVTLASNVENLRLTGSDAVNGTGNSLDNSMVGNAAANVLTGLGGNDTLNGGSGADTMIGGTGNDTYYVGTSGDVVTENANEGTDTVLSTISYTLGANVENLTLQGTSNLSGTGNTLNNTIIGNTGANTLTGGGGADVLNGGAGSDTMVGGTGDDSYYVASTGDVVTENANEGFDTVFSTISYTLGANVEALTLTGSATIYGKGNSLNNTLTGNVANNTLIGGGGADTFMFVVGGGTDKVSDFSAAQNDLINVHAFTHGVANTGLMSQSGADTVIDFGGGNVVIISNTTYNDPNLLSHIVW